MAGNDSKDREQLHRICDMSYKAQAIWFLNSFWNEHSGEAEKLWKYVEMANKIDLERHEDGCGLDELNAHRLLEIFDETLTVREMRTQLRNVGAILDSERPKNVPLCHLLLARYRSDWHYFVNAPQGASEEIDRAQAKLEAAKEGLRQAEARAHEAAVALAASEKAAAESAAAAADLAAKEAELRAAQAELDAALAAVQREEDAYNAKAAELRQKSETGGVVSMNRAKNELAQHLAEDPLPLRKAKITAEAAAKRNERALQAAAAARGVAEHAAAEARQAAARSAEAKAAADAAVDHARSLIEEAEVYLAEVQKTASGGKGALWWIERELHEQRKYLPTSRGGIAK